jgi:error-prone DNA polymerase
MRYAELHCKTNFSFLEGASHPEELVARAAELEYAALAITDSNSVAGVVRAHGEAKECGLKLLIGAEITPHDAPPVVLVATDRKAYGRLTQLITVGRRQAPKGQCRLSYDEIAQHAEGLIAAIVPPTELWEANPFADSTHDPSFRRKDSPPTFDLHDYRDIFGDRCYPLAELLHGCHDEARLDELRTISRRTRVPLVAAGDVHYHVPQRRTLRDVLTAVRANTTVHEARDKLFPNAERHLRPLDEIFPLFARAPDALARTIEICGTNIPKSLLRRARRRWRISSSWRGRAPASVSPTASHRKSSS